MKFYVVLVVLAALVASSQQVLFSELTKRWHGIYQSAMERCINETGVDRAMAERIMPFGEFKNDTKLKRFVHCVGRYWNFNDEEGRLRPEVIVKLVGVDHPDYSQCYSIYIEGDQIETTYRSIHCGYQILQKEYQQKELSRRPKQTFSDLKAIWNSYIYKHHVECIAETGIDRESVERFIQHREYNDDDKITKCFVTCIYKKLHILDENDNKDHYVYLKALNIHDPAVIEESSLITRCFNLTHEDACEKGYMISKCMYAAVEDYFKKSGER